MMDKFIQNLIDEENNAVISTMAFMSYNPSFDGNAFHKLSLFHGCRCFL